MIFRTIVGLVLVASGALAQSTSAPQEGLIRLNGTRLFVKSIGKGEPIVVVHGGPGMNQSYLTPHLQVLSRKNRLIFYDQRASGKSDIPNADSVSLDFFVEDIEAIRKEFKIEKLVLLAHSWGAIPCIQYALDHPSTVKKLILVNPVPLSTEFNAEMADQQRRRSTSADSLERVAIIASPEFKEGKSEAYQKLLLLSFRHSFYKPTNFPKLSLDIPANYMTASRALFRGLGPDLQQYNYYTRLGEINIPALIIHGRSDAIPLAAQTKTQSGLVGSSLVIFRYSGHFAFIEEPERFRKEVQSFLLRP